MEINVISQEIVKPSFPTPSHLKIFKLSLLDQLIPAPYVPIVLYYPNYNGASSHSQLLERLNTLKVSLSETLTPFYPLAGVIKDDLSIECNDDGAYYATAKVSCSLYEFLDKPDLHSIYRFLPCDPSFMGSMAGTRVTNIQVNLFQCGGIAIGLCISHKILDGAALKSFLKAWAGKSSGIEKPICPEFLGSSLFPAKGKLWMKDSAMIMWAAGFKQGKSVTKRIVFSGTSITTLKVMSTTKSNNPCPTRVEAVSAFLWKAAKTASSNVNCTNSERASLLTHIVNLRRRAIPSLPEHSIGNLIWLAGAKCKANREADLPFLAEQIRLSVSKINGDHVNKLCGHKGNTLMRKSLKDIGHFISKEDVDYFGFSSWCGFGYYEIDFGWGKPMWISSIPLSAAVFMNLIILMDTKYGDGIEAWVTLDEREMNELEHNKELLAFGSMDPRPLNLGNFA